MFTAPLAILRNARRFGQDRRGTFAVTTALTAMTLCMACGAALDYSTLNAERTVMRDALDAAVLAAAADLSEGNLPEGQIRQRFSAMFETNLLGRSRKVEKATITALTVDRAGATVSASAQMTVPMAFMTLAGYTNVDVHADSEAVFSSTRVELSMMLDVTGSMGERGKLEALKSAASDTVRQLLPSAGASQRMRIALVPYAQAVNVGSFAPAVSSDARQPCVTERSGPSRFTDAGPVAGKAGAASPTCPVVGIRPLGADPAPLLATIAGFTPSGYTAGHLGVAWSWYALSPSWSSVWPGASRPASYADGNVRKIALLMTDGEFNTIYTPGWSSPDYAVELCRSMKRAGVTVYTVAFDAPKAAERTLRACASPDTAGATHFFSASDAGELHAAFQAITKDVQGLRLSR